MERIVNIMEENPNRENIMKVWKDYTIEDAIIVIEKAMKAIKSKTINSCWRKLCPDVVHDLSGYMTEAIKEIWKRLWIWQKYIEGERFQDMDLGEIQEPISTPEELTEDDLTKMSASEPVPENEEEI